LPEAMLLGSSYYDVIFAAVIGCFCVRWLVLLLWLLIGEFLLPVFYKFTLSKYISARDVLSCEKEG